MGSVSRRGPRRVGARWRSSGGRPRRGDSTVRGPRRRRASVGGDAEHRLDPREVEERGRGVRPRGSGVDGATVAIARGVRVVVLLAVRLRAHDVLGGVEHGERVGERYGETELGRRRAELLGGDPPVGRGGGEGAREHLDGSLVPPATGASGSAKRPGHLLRRLRKMYLAHLARRGRRRGRPRGGHVPSRGRPRATRRSLCPTRKRPQRLFTMTPRKPRRPDVNSAAAAGSPEARRRSPLSPRARRRNTRDSRAFAKHAIRRLRGLLAALAPSRSPVPSRCCSPRKRRSGEEMRIDRWIAELGLTSTATRRTRCTPEATPVRREHGRDRDRGSTSPASTPTDRGPRRKRTTTRGRPTIRPLPSHWGPEPLIQTRDYRELPGGYGFGSSTLYAWIESNMAKDAAAAASPAASPDLR